MTRTTDTTTCCSHNCCNRYGLATVIAILIGAPLGWLLSHLAMLPFYLGLFFFMLGGLLIGAIQYRIALPAAPMNRRTVLCGSILVILSMWLVSITFEYRHLAPDAVDFVKMERVRMTAAQIKESEEQIPQRIREQLAIEYPPGGLLGYIQWAVRSGQMKVGQTDGGHPLVFRLKQGRIGWPLRVMLSIALLSFGVISQGIGLTKDPNAPRDFEPETDSTPHL